MNKFLHTSRVALVAVVCGLSFARIAHATDVDVIATGAVSGAFKRITPEFEHASGDKLVLAWGPSMGASPEAIPNRIASGEPADVVIMVGSALDKLIRDGKFVAATRVDIAQSGIGVGVKAGTPLPDVSTAAALRQALLDAKSVGYSEGASGTYITQTLLKRLGVADQVGAKRKVIPGKQLVGEALARGEIELGLQQISELRVVPGVTYVGPLPAELQQVSVVSAAVSAQARHPDAARAFVSYLTGSAATQAIQASGLDLPSQASAAVDTRIVRKGDMQIEVLSQGQGPVVVMLPSLGRSVRDYDDVARRLAASGLRVVRPEPRGIGQSKGPMDNLSVHDFASDVAAVVESEGKGPVVVVGHAWGNFPARQLAADRPDLVKGVVLVAASAGKVPPGSTEKPINAEMRKAIDGPSDMSLPEQQRLEYLRLAFFAAGNDPRVWLDGWHSQTHEAESHARNTTPVDDYFAAGKAPILDLQGEEDTVAPRRFSNVLKSMLGDRVTVVVIPHAGHAMAPEQPQAMADAIASFTRSVYGVSH